MIIAESFGVDTSIFDELLTDINSANIENKLKPLLSYVKKLTLNPGKISDSDAQAVFDAGWSEQALHDAITVCALFNFMNRIVDGHGVITNDSIKSGQKQRAKLNKDKPVSETSYRDYGRMIGVYPGEPGEYNKIIPD